MSELQICHVSTMSNWGGVERLLEDTLLYPPLVGTHHHLLATSWAPEITASILAGGISTHHMERVNRYDLQAIAKAVQWLRRERIDVVHSYNAFANIWGKMLAKLAHIPVLITGEHGTVWRTEGRLLQLDRLAQRTASATIANSKAASILVQSRYGIPPDKIKVVANAVAPLPTVDTMSLRQAWGVHERLIVGSIGRLDNPKDYRTFIDAAALVLQRNRDLCFVLVGGGQLEDELRQQVDTLGIGDHFLMTGWRADARQLVQTFDLFVGTSIRESFGNVFVEAALAALPVIAPAIDGIPEVVSDGETGLLLIPRRPIRPSKNIAATPIGPYSVVNGQLSQPRALDPNELAEAILWLAANPETRRKLGYEGKKQAQLRFGLGRYMQDLNDIYHSLTPISNLN